MIPDDEWFHADTIAMVLIQYMTPDDVSLIMGDLAALSAVRAIEAFMIPPFPDTPPMGTRITAILP